MVKKRAKPKGWRKEPVRHGLASKGVKTGRKPRARRDRGPETGMKLGKFQPTLKQMEDLLVIAAQEAKTDEEYAQLLEAADDIGDMREDRRIMAVKEGERSGPTGSMPIVDMRMNQMDIDEFTQGYVYAHYPNLEGYGYQADWIEPAEARDIMVEIVKQISWVEDVPQGPILHMKDGRTLYALDSEDFPQPSDESPEWGEEEY